MLLRAILGPEPRRSRKQAPVRAKWSGIGSNLFRYEALKGSTTNGLFARAEKLFRSHIQLRTTITDWTDINTPFFQKSGFSVKLFSRVVNYKLDGSGYFSDGPPG
jgi:hypothetical protein